MRQGTRSFPKYGKSYTRSDIMCFKLTDVFTIQIPALPRPTLRELKKKFPWIKAIKRDTSPTKPITLGVGTVLSFQEGWSWEDCASAQKMVDMIFGVEYKKLLVPEHKILLGYQQACWLEEHKDEFPDLTAFRKSHSIDFPGLVISASRYPSLLVASGLIFPHVLSLEVEKGDGFFPCFGREGCDYEGFDWRHFEHGFYDSMCIAVAVG